MKMRLCWKRSTTIFIVLALLMLTNLFMITSRVNGQDELIYWPTYEWNLTDPADQGMNNSSIYKLYDYVDTNSINIHSVSIVRNGFLIHEEYISGFKLRSENSYGPEPNYYGIEVVINGSLHVQFSSTKTIIALLVGIAIDKGYIDNVTQTFSSFFPGLTYNSNQEEISIEHLLTMTSGIYGDSDPEFEWDRTIQEILNPALYGVPGISFRYSSVSTHLLSAIINKSTGQKTSEFAEEYLFDPLGISREDWYWQGNSETINFGGYGLYFTPQAMSKIGLLMINNGMWNGTQVISENWILDLGTPQPNGFYGYLVWIDKYSYHTAGLLGQCIFLIPAYDLVVVFTGAILSDANNKYIYIIDNFILPAIEGVGAPDPVIPGYPLLIFGEMLILGVIFSIKIEKNKIK